MPAIYSLAPFAGVTSAPRLIAASGHTGERAAPRVRRREAEAAAPRAELRSRGLRAADREAGGGAGEGRRARGPGHDRDAEPRQAATWADSRPAWTDGEGGGRCPPAGAAAGTGAIPGARGTRWWTFLCGQEPRGCGGRGWNTRVSSWRRTGGWGWGSWDRGGHQQLGRFRERWPRGLGPWRCLSLGSGGQLCGRQERQTRPHSAWPRGRRSRGLGHGRYTRTLQRDLG